MYEAFFGLTEKPFALNPDPDFLYLGNKHSMALTMLQYGLENSAGITVISGEIGSGKTTLIRRFLEELDSTVRVGLVSNTHSAYGQLMDWVANAFDIDTHDRTNVELFEAFNRFVIDEYAAGRRTVLIIDEAQNLEKPVLEELRLLTNINADKDFVLQLVLVGQPELRKHLRQPGLEQFVQRIGVDFHLKPLDVDETDHYIEHRLAVAGASEPIFEPLARRFIHYQAGGVPRLINGLCDTALVYAFGDDSTSVSGELVRDLVVERIRDGLFGAGVVADPDASSSERLASVASNYARAAADLALSPAGAIPDQEDPGKAHA